MLSQTFILRGTLKGNCCVNILASIYTHIIHIMIMNEVWDQKKKKEN